MRNAKISQLLVVLIGNLLITNHRWMSRVHVNNVKYDFSLGLLWLMGCPCTNHAVCVWLVSNEVWRFYGSFMCLTCKTRIRSVERRICPIAAACTVVELLILKCFKSWPWPFKVTRCHRSCEYSTCTMTFSMCVLWTPTQSVDLFSRY